MTPLNWWDRGLRRDPLVVVVEAERGWDDSQISQEPGELVTVYLESVTALTTNSLTYCPRSSCPLSSPSSWPCLSCQEAGGSWRWQVQPPSVRHSTSLTDFNLVNSFLLNKFWLIIILLLIFLGYYWPEGRGPIVLKRRFYYSYIAFPDQYNHKLNGPYKLSPVLTRDDFLLFWSSALISAEV